MRNFESAYSSVVICNLLVLTNLIILLIQDYLAQVEKNLRGFFNEFATGVYFEDIACRVKRFYFHAVAQFLRLKSQSKRGNK